MSSEETSTSDWKLLNFQLKSTSQIALPACLPFSMNEAWWVLQIDDWFLDDCARWWIKRVFDDFYCVKSCIVFLQTDQIAQIDIQTE